MPPHPERYVTDDSTLEIAVKDTAVLAYLVRRSVEDQTCNHMFRAAPYREGYECKPLSHECLKKCKDQAFSKGNSCDTCTTNFVTQTLQSSFRSYCEQLVFVEKTSIR